MTQVANYIDPSHIFKALGNPLRLTIVHTLLRDGCRNVGYLEKTCAMSQSCISQHLQKLRTEGIVCAQRSGNEVYYRICNEDIGILVGQLFREEYHTNEL